MTPHCLFGWLLRILLDQPPVLDPLDTWQTHYPA
jgi:hypothetical protein